MAFLPSGPKARDSLLGHCRSGLVAPNPFSGRHRKRGPDFASDLMRRDSLGLAVAWAGQVAQGGSPCQAVLTMSVQVPVQTLSPRSLTETVSKT
jgi:hypothetical protein